MSNCVVTRNTDKNGIEIKFDNKPSVDVLRSIKGRGFGWGRRRKVWYKRYSEADFLWAKTLCEESDESVGSSQQAISAEKINKPTIASSPILTSRTPTVNIEPPKKTPKEQRLALICNGQFFKDNPGKVLGEIVDTTDRFGKPIQVVRGNIRDSLDRIRVKTPIRFEHFQDGKNIGMTKEAVKVQGQRVEQIIQQTLIENKAKTDRDGKCGDGIQCLGDSIKTFNPHLSEDEIKVWVTYQTLRGLFDVKVIAGNDWGRYLVKQNGYDFLASKVGEWTAFDGEEYVPNVLFYAGNIYNQINTIKRRKEGIVQEIGDKLYHAQLDQLEALKPPLLSITDGEENKLILSPFDKIWEQFKVRELSSGVTFENPKNVVYVFAKYFLDGLTKEDFIVDKNRSSSFDIVNHWLDRSSFPRGTSDTEKVSRKRAAQVVGTHLFDRFLFEGLTREDRLRIEYLWNLQSNNYVDVNPDKIPVGFEIGELFKGGKLTPRDAQREGVSFLNINGTGIVAYDVGVGKTMTAILYIAYMFSTGQSKRPLIVVPNPTYKKWIGEIHGVFAKKDIKEGKKIIHKKGDLLAEGIIPQYPINDFYNLGVGFIANAKDDQGMTLKVGEYSITIVTYEGLKIIGFKEESESGLVSSIKTILSQGETGRKAELIEESINTLVDKALKDSELFIEYLGFDSIIVDECHNFKNLFTQVRGEAESTEKGIKRDTNHYEIQGKKPSSRAIKLFMLNRYIHLKNGRRNTIGLSATPFTNSPLEIYSMLALFAYDGLKEQGIENIVTFFNRFINESYEAVWTTKGRFEQRAVIRGFNNLPSLQALIFKYIIYKTGEEANIQRPEKVVLPLKNDSSGITLPLEFQASSEIPPTEEQLHWFKEISKFARQKGFNKEEPSELEPFYPPDPVKRMVLGRDLIAINAAQLCTLSPYLLPWRKVNPSTITAEEFITSSPKMQYVMDCVASVKKYHESKKEPISGQVIYANRGKDFFLHLKEWLVTKIGYAPSEVEIISGGVSAKKKEQVKEHFLDGKVKIIIGSATIREGIDLQKRSTVLYNCFLDWNPTDIKQLEGRIWRFGNIYSHVRIVVPLIENSFDIFLNQKLGEKTARVNDIWSRAGRKTVLKLEELNPDELKKGLISDPLELVNMAVTEQTENLKTEKTLLEGYTEELEKVQGEIGKLDGLTQKIEAAVTRASNLFNYPSDVDPKRSQKISEMEAKTLKEKYQKVRAFSKVFIKTNFSEYYDLKRAVELHIDLNKKLKRIEKNILSKNNLTLSDNFLSLVAKFQRRREEIDRTIEHLESDENREKLLKAIEKEKAEKQINSRPLETRVNEFKRLNFLLECNSTPIHAENVCNIYGIQRGEAKVVPMEKDIPDKTIKTEAIIDLKPIPKDPSQALLKALTIAIKVAPQTRKMKLEKMRKGLELALRLRAKRKVS